MHLLPFPAAYRDFDGDEAAATERCLRDLHELTDTVAPADTIASILIEPVQGEGGYTPAPAAFLRGLRAFCDEHGILLIADEVQTGFGRTGTMWAFEHAGIVPDVVCLAKAIANGLPLSAIVSSAGAPGALGPERPRLHVRRQPRGVRGRARRHPDDQRAGARRQRGRPRRRAHVRICGGSRPRTTGSATCGGPGSMIGVEFVEDRATKVPDGETVNALIARCADEGLLLLSCGRGHQVVRWIPPIDVTGAEIGEALEIFGDALAGLPRSGGGGD